MVAEYEASGQNRSEFCRKHEICLSTLNRYLTRQREVHAEAAGVKLMSVELSGAHPAERNKGDSGVAIALAGGRRIEIARGFDARTLVQLLGVLERF